MKLKHKISVNANNKKLIHHHQHAYKQAPKNRKKKRAELPPAASTGVEYSECLISFYNKTVTNCSLFVDQISPLINFFDGKGKDQLISDILLFERNKIERAFEESKERIINQLKIQADFDKNVQENLFTFKGESQERSRTQKLSGKK